MASHGCLCRHGRRLTSDRDAFDCHLESRSVQPAKTVLHASSHVLSATQPTNGLPSAHSEYNLLRRAALVANLPLDISRQEYGDLGRRNGKSSGKPGGGPGRRFDEATASGLDRRRYVPVLT